MILLILIFSFKVNAFDMTAIYSKVPKHSIRTLMSECNFKNSNADLFIKNLNQTQYNCLLANTNKTKNKIDKAAKHNNSKKAAKIYFKNIDCDLIVDTFDKNVCFLLKRGY